MKQVWLVRAQVKSDNSSAPAHEGVIGIYDSPEAVEKHFPNHEWIKILAAPPYWMVTKEYAQTGTGLIATPHDVQE